MVVNLRYGWNASRYDNLLRTKCSKQGSTSKEKEKISNSSKKRDKKIRICEKYLIVKAQVVIVLLILLHDYVIITSLVMVFNKSCWG